MDVYCLEELARARLQEREDEIRRRRLCPPSEPLSSRLARLLLWLALRLDATLWSRKPALFRPNRPTSWGV